MNNLLGTSRDLLPSELPTLRDVLRYGLLLREQNDDDKRNYPTANLAKDIYPAVIENWKRANDLFKPPVINSRITVLNKIQDSRELAKDISLGRGKSEVKKRFIAKLGKLFDISKLQV